jgi:hypothetical protein
MLVLQCINVVTLGFTIATVRRRMQNLRIDPIAATRDQFNRAKRGIRVLLVASFFISLSSVVAISKVVGLLSRESLSFVTVIACSLFIQFIFLAIAYGSFNRLDTGDFSVFRNTNTITN